MENKIRRFLENIKEPTKDEIIIRLLLNHKDCDIVVKAIEEFDRKFTIGFQHGKQDT